MAKARDHKAFLKMKRAGAETRAVEERVKDYDQVYIFRSDEASQEQAGRCMDCGTPFCMSGCPIGNIVPEWQDMMVHGQWEEAFRLLDSTNNLPEMTGRVCPAPCEYACVLGINDDPITIRENELAIIEHAFKHGIIKPTPPATRTGKKVAVVGSGPAGLSCAMQLNRAGHTVVVYEEADKPGGLLRYGIPNFKLEKWVVDRRVEFMEKEGITFTTNTRVGRDVSVEELRTAFDAICFTCGSRKPRDLDIEGRELSGVHFAMDYLTKATIIAQGGHIPDEICIDAEGKDVVVIGGGDTGSDCVGTANRQGAKSITQIEVMPMPPEARTEDHPWPHYPMLLKTSTSHEEGAARQWSVLTKAFKGEDGVVKELQCVKASFVKNEETGRMQLQQEAGSEFTLKADLVLLAIGFVHTEHDGYLTDMGVTFDGRGNVQTDGAFQTDVKGVFSAGDMRAGQSLVVRAISEGRRAAYAIDTFLMGTSNLPNLPKSPL